MTIRIKLTGGLGNQMFQFATAFAIAKRNNVRLSLDLNYINQRQLFNGFELEKVFNIYSKVSFLNKTLSFQSINFKEILNKIDVTFYNFKEPHFHYTSKILDIPKHSFLDGYWQSELYFKDYSKEIKKIFNFSDKLDEQNELISNDINQSNSISIHIRRGDFLLKRNDNHYVNLKEYYLKAIEDSSKSINNPKYFIFTDDPLWVTKNFIIKYSHTVIDLNHDTKSFLDMYLMSLCKCNIIANSTFSWWGAWLAKYKDKVVVAPSTSEKYGHWADPKLLPKEWLQL